MKRILLTLILLSLMPASVSAYSFLYTCGPTWQNLPITYYINQNGSNDIAFPTLVQIIDSSYGAWEEPCCSRFRAQYGGTTQATAVTNSNRIVLSWEESSWDPRFGSQNVTIGVTLTSVWNDCTIADAPILFNGVGFVFTNTGSGTDLQSIATHEIGHMLGLGHSSVYQATMYASYAGGTGARTLHQDDTDGVCALYNKPCSCVTTNDCIAGDICQSGVCRNVPCTSDTNCQDGLICQTSTGKCIVPPCTDDASCGEGYFCEADGSCKSRCPVCRSCTTNNECGGANAVCLQNGKCVVFCQEGGLCPGDSECYNVQGNYLCLNANADTAGICPDGYSCYDAPQCTTNDDCNPGDTCQQGTCVGPCANVQCPDGQVCRDSRCYPDLQPENNSTGNNTANNATNNTTGNNTTGNNTTGNNTTGNNTSGNNTNPGTDPVIVIIQEEAPKESSCGGCASTNSNGSVALLILGLLGLLRRRR